MFNRKLDIRSRRRSGEDLRHDMGGSISVGSGIGSEVTSDLHNPDCILSYDARR